MDDAPTVLRSRRRRVGVSLWLAGMLGVVVLSALVLPGLIAGEALPAPQWVVILASIIQSGALLAVATSVGTALSHRVGLRAPLVEAAAASQPLGPPLRSQLAPGLIWGLVAGVLLAASSLGSPPALGAVQARFDPPLVARVLYGGITEELLLRWGLMTLLVWVGWRFLQHRQGAPRGAIVWAAVVLSALLFGVGHLPAAAVLVGYLNGEIVAYVVGANTAFGVVFGTLFWRYGLEAAMIAHALAHVVAYAVAGL